MTSVMTPTWTPPSVMTTPLTSNQKIRDVQRIMNHRLFQISHLTLNIRVRMLNQHQYIFMNAYIIKMRPIALIMKNPIAEII